jgi:mRNA interferase YafQ
MGVEKQKSTTPDEFFRSLESYDDFVYNVFKTHTFKKSVRKCYKRKLNLDLLENVIVKIAKGEKLPENNLQHQLQGYKKSPSEEVMECHIQPDWLLVWKQNNVELILLLTNTGSHSDLFE